MATKTLTTRIVLRNDTAENWANANPVLLKGEIGEEIDTHKYKIGNGVDAWNDLKTYVNIDSDDYHTLQILSEMLNDDDFGKVDDVKVNDESVVTNKVANISIGMLTFTPDEQSMNSNGESFTSNITLHKVAKTGKYSDLVGAIKVVDNLESESTTNALSANQGHILSQKINNVQFTETYQTIEDMVNALNSASKTSLRVGMNLWVVQTNVPDFWISAVNDTSVSYGYVDDNTLIEDINDTGSIQIGYYNISMLETQKVDLTDYVTKEFLTENFVTKESLTQQLSELTNKLTFDLMSFKPEGNELSEGKIAQYDDGMMLSGKFYYTTKDEPEPESASSFNATMKLPIRGRDAITVDATEDNDFIEIGLDNAFIDNLTQMKDDIDGLTTRVDDIEKDDTIVRTTDTLILNGGTSEV